MKFQVTYFNELPFIVELQDDKYEVLTQSGTFELQFNSDWYKIHTAQFANHAEKTVYVGQQQELENIIQNEAIVNYAFDNCKTFVNCRITHEENITNTAIENIEDAKAIEKLKTNLIKNNIIYNDAEHLSNIAEQKYQGVSETERFNYKKSVAIDDVFSSINNIYGYYEALNNFIMHYANTRNFFWVQKLNENTLEGTSVTKYVDGNLYDSYTFAGLVPSIMPHKRKYPDLSDEDMMTLKDRLKTGAAVPVERSLILIARSLWFRMEYRSAIIESSAALEYVVEKKLVEKMSNLGKSNQFITNELNKTRTNFTQRCDHFLKLYTGQSFSVDNPTLWCNIDSHRKNYRHPIAHSNIEPDKATTEEMIGDFEQALTYINSL